MHIAQYISDSGAVPADAMCSLVRIGCIPTNGTCIEHNRPMI